MSTVHKEPWDAFSGNYLTPLLIDQQFNLYLGTREKPVQLNALHKTLFLFYLQQKKPIYLHDLVDHQEELLNIYLKLEFKHNLWRAKEYIYRLVDLRNNSIHEKCSRIKRAFLDYLSEPLAEFYYIKGKRGRAKHIELPRELVIFTSY